MIAAEIIRKKRDGEQLSSSELTDLIGGYLTGKVTDYQISAFLMTIFFRGMTSRETADLTRVMMESGITYKLKTDRPLMDKHSTGGVGDKVSLILAPLAAACGLADPMVAGRGLGHTGGTLDKLESIPGFSVNLTAAQFEAQVAELGVAMIGQSDDFVPADKRLYALRDVTATVESIPLICASILSKKLASGTHGLVMDVKTGTGAFMADLENARALARALTETGQALGMPVRCLITDMNQPLGNAIGNANEVVESIDCLRGGGPADLREITLALATEMLLLAGVDSEETAARTRAETALDDGSAWEIFRQLVSRQGGDVAAIDDPRKLPQASHSKVIPATRAGYLNITDCRRFGVAALVLGAGRRQASDPVDPAVGIVLHKKHGDPVAAGEPLATIAYNSEALLPEAERLLTEAWQVDDAAPELNPLIWEKLV